MQLARQHQGDENEQETRGSARSLVAGHGVLDGVQAGVLPPLGHLAHVVVGEAAGLRPHAFAGSDHARRVDQ